MMIKEIGSERSDRDGELETDAEVAETEKETIRFSVATHRNPNRVMSTSLFLDGSREPRSTG